MSKAEWMEHTTEKDWLLDGHPIKGERFLEMWNALDWGNAYCDPGPSPAGNPGPYWHVPYPPEETVHRLYPKFPRKFYLLLEQVCVEMMEQKATTPVEGF